MQNPKGSYKMKTLRVLAVLATVVTMSTAAYGQIPFTFAVSPGRVVPDGDQNGTLLKGDVNGLDSSKAWYLQSVSLDLSGSPFGNNGDIYLKLIYQDKNTILLNRPGLTESSQFGYADNGMSINLVRDGAPGAPTVDAHYYQNGVFAGGGSGGQPISGTFLVDGRVTVVTGSESRTSFLSAFDGLNPNGEWQLFAQDYSSGQQLQINSWGLTFTNVPEPSQYALLAGLGLIGFVAYRRYNLRVA